MSGSDVATGCRHKRQRFDDAGDGGDEYQELFQNKVAICVVE